jgi:hypothetical protein
MRRLLQKTCKRRVFWVKEGLNRDCTKRDCTKRDCTKRDCAKKDCAKRDYSTKISRNRAE